jgi:hypothetical protein
LSFCRTAGFARVELRNELPTTAAVACFRRWDEQVDTAEATPRLAAVLHNTNHGINFSTRRDDYLTAWFEGPERDLGRGEVRPEVGEFGTIPIDTRREGPAAWQATFKLPPGLSPGWHAVRVRVGHGPPSNGVPVAVDVPVADVVATITGVADGATWTPNAIALSSGTTLCLWVEGLPDNADRANVRALLGSSPVPVTHVAPAQPELDARQVNVEVPADFPPGATTVRLALGGSETAPVTVEIHP